MFFEKKNNSHIVNLIIHEQVSQNKILESVFSIASRSRGVNLINLIEFWIYRARLVVG